MAFYQNRSLNINNMIIKMAWRKALLTIPSLLGLTSAGYSTLSASKDQPADYDVAVIGGGSGGISFSFQARRQGLSTIMFDYVDTTIHGTKWSIGGTCVNAGCTPKKLFHQSAILGEHLFDAGDYGWNLEGVKRGEEKQVRKKFNWQKMVDRVNLYVKSLNFGYKNQLEEKGVKYINAFATLIDKNTVFYSADKQNVIKFIETGQIPEISQNTKKLGIVKVRNIVIATGCRPTYLDIEGKDLAITSDDIFWKKSEPGKTLIVGGGYVAVEIAGFLTQFGYDTTMMTRSDYLKNFDKDMVKMIIKDLKQKNVNIIEKSLPKEMKKEGDQIVVRHCKTDSPEDCSTSKFNTVLFAAGRNANTKWLNLQKLGVQVNKDNNKVITAKEQIECTDVQGVYAIGDVVDGVPELTGTVQKAGIFLAKRIAHRLGKAEMSQQQYKDSFIDFKDYPTTLFSPLEYSVCGWSQQKAIKQLGQGQVQVYHSKFLPLEEAILTKFDHEGNDYKTYAYMKVVTDREGNVYGLHYVGPNAGEIMQGYAVAMRMGLTKHYLERTIGIHPTVAEEFTNLRVTKESGESYMRKGCCG